MKLKFVSLVGAALAMSAMPAFADSVNVLWYTGGTESSGPGSYEAGITALVGQEENPLFNTTGSVNTWNVTFWTGGAMPVGSWNVLVAASSIGGWTSYPSYTALTSSVTEASFGSRVMLTGQDADWHYLNYPGPGSFDGPAGFLIDAINWASHGTGMGGVMLDTGLEYSMFSGVGTNVGGSNAVTIPAAYSSFPINKNLTSAGLSSWSTSAHESFVGSNPAKWTAINTETGTDNPITIVSAATSGGGTTPDCTSTALLSLLGVGFLATSRRFFGKR